MMRTTKYSVQMHVEGGRAHPAINVKCYNTGGTIDEVVERFGCSRDVAQQALNYAYDSGVEIFWELADELARESFGRRAEVFAEGRSGGWLTVHGLDEVVGWDRGDLQKWMRFEKKIKALMADLGSRKSMLDRIDANGWADEEALLLDEAERNLTRATAALKKAQALRGGA